MSEFKIIPLKEIHPDPNQPRRIYDETAMQELTQSVKEKGVLQPILIRPNGKGYILVCGERRYRASKDAGLEEIPAVIRAMDDNEALELQIIENLQRKDVHPMEEAVAFRSLKERYSVEDIAHRVGKTPVFVAQRIKLTDLIQDFQDMLFMDKIALKDAISVCRLPEATQKEILKELTSWGGKDWRKNKDWKADRAGNFLERDSQDLSKATFKTNDPALYPEVGACNTCQFNTANQQLLFPELGKKRICNNPTCYAIKTERAYLQKIKSVLEDPSMLFVCTNSYMGSDEKKKIRAVEDMGVKVLHSDVFEEVDKPDPVEPFEKYKESWMMDTDESEIAECRQQWKEDVAEYEKDLKEYNELVSSGRVHKAFVVAGWSNEGKTIDIVFKAKKGGKMSAAAESGDNAELVLLEQEIAEVEQREKRNKELDGEKIHEQVKTILPACKQYTENCNPLQQEEIAGIIMAMLEAGSYGFRDKVSEIWGVQIDYRYDLKVYETLSTLTELGLNQLIRLFILDKCDITKGTGSHLNNSKALAIHNIANQYEGHKVSTIEAEQTAKAEKRQANYNKRLTALKEKRKQLRAELKPPKQKTVKSKK
jgi:ParB family chromosome partitioning protein